MDELVAMLGASDLGRRVVAAFPWSQVPHDVAWEVKIALLLLIVVNAVFALGWALRQFNDGLILPGAMPVAADDSDPRPADAAARLVNRSAQHVNKGLRAYHVGLAALAWIIHPAALILASLLVLREL